MSPRLVVPSSAAPLAIPDQDHYLRTAPHLGHVTWFACWEPERPVDVHTAFHDCCRSCLIAAQAAAANGYEPAQVGTGVATMAERLERFGPAPRSAVSG